MKTLIRNLILAIPTVRKVRDLVREERHRLEEQKKFLEAALTEARNANLVLREEKKSLEIRLAETQLLCSTLTKERDTALAALPLAVAELVATQVNVQTFDHQDLVKSCEESLAKAKEIKHLLEHTHISIGQQLIVDQRQNNTNTDKDDKEAAIDVDLYRAAALNNKAANRYDTIKS